MRNNFLIGIIFCAVLATQFSCSQMRQMELERNRSLWNESKIENYKMTIEIQKPGHATPNGKFIITVRDNVAKSIKPINKPDLEMLDTQIQFGRYSTIDGIFRFIENAGLNSNSWSRQKIEYDAKLGYPKKVDLDKSGVLDDELYFEVLEFAIEESSGDKASEKPSPKIISVPAAEITKAEFSVRSREGSGNNFKDEGGMSFSKDGTAFRSYPKRNYEKDSDENLEQEQFQAVASQEQFQKLAQIIAENDFSNLKDVTQQSSTEYILIVHYSGKKKSVKMNLTGKNTAEINEILNGFEKLKNQLDWTEIK